MKRFQNFVWPWRRKILKEEGLFESFLPLGAVKKNPRDFPNKFPQEDGAGFDDHYAEPEKRYYFVLRGLILVLLVTFAFRLVSLQVTKGQENYLLAEGNRLRTELVAAPRGLFYDRKGVALVKNMPSFSVELRLADLPKKQDDRAQVVSQIATSLSLDTNMLQQKITEAKDRDQLVLIDRLDRETALKYELRLQGVKGVALVKTPLRQYNSTASLGHALGYIGKIDTAEKQKRPELLSTAYVGKSGIEKSYDEYLQGQPGIETLEVDSLNRVIRSVGSSPAKVGRSVVLGLDEKLQDTTAKSLSETITKFQATSGVAVALDPRNGEIRAMVSLPSYDNNIFSFSSLSSERQKVLTDPLSPLMNRAIAGQYPAGSTIKPFVAAAGLQEKVISANTRIDTSAGKIEIGQWTFADWKIHGTTDVKQAIAESNNIFFYTIGGGNGGIAGLGAEKLADYLRRFGFGDKTGVDLPGEAAGLVPVPDWKKKVKKEGWYVGDTYHLSIGQGDLLVTPLQLVRATSAVANGGKLFRPTLVHSILGNDSSEEELVSSKRVVDQVVDATNLELVRQGMRQAVTAGSARSLNNLPVAVAAKTGTAQFDVAKEKTHSWFTCFAPYDNPELAISIIIEGGGEGYLAAAPVARNMFEQYFNLPITPIASQPAE